MIICADITEVELPITDVLISDPPYSEHVHANTTSQSIGGGTRHNDLGFDHLSDLLRGCIAKQVSLTRRWSIIYSDIEALGWWRGGVEAAGGKYIRAMPWVRWSMPQLSGDRPPQGFELITAYYGKTKGRKHWNGPGNHIAFTEKALRGAGKHKTEKPLDQALTLVNWFSDPGETVLDLCAGSGVIGVACALLGREYIGYEMDPAWADKANQRVENAKIGMLSERDQERHGRWMDAEAERSVDRARVRNHTAAVREKLDAASECVDDEGEGNPLSPE